MGREVLKHAQTPVSLDAPIGDPTEGETFDLKDSIPDNTSPPPVEAAFHAVLREHVTEVLSSLTPRERRVIELRFGLQDGRARTLDEVGTEFHVSRERIRQIQDKAMRKLRNPCQARRLESFIH